GRGENRSQGHPNDGSAHPSLPGATPVAGMPGVAMFARIIGVGVIAGFGVGVICAIGVGVAATRPPSPGPAAVAEMLARTDTARSDAATISSFSILMESTPILDQPHP